MLGAQVMSMKLTNDREESEVWGVQVISLRRTRRTVRRFGRSLYEC